MSKLRVTEWKKLPVSLAELCLDTTLRCGQSFRWKKIRGDEWLVYLSTLLCAEIPNIEAGLAHFTVEYYR